MMALFHFSVTQVRRSAGQSIIASAAYRAGERLYSEYYGETNDYMLRMRGAKTILCPFARFADMIQISGETFKKPFHI